MQSTRILHYTVANVMRSLFFASIPQPLEGLASRGEVATCAHRVRKRCPQRLGKSAIRATPVHLYARGNNPGTDAAQQGWRPLAQGNALAPTNGTALPFRPLKLAWGITFPEAVC